MVVLMAKESDITTIRIPKSVKDELKDVANDKEPYHATISRLVSENQQLKQSNELNVELLSLYRNKEKFSYNGNAFADKVIEDFIYGDGTYTLQLYKSIDEIYFSNKSIDEKIKSLEDVFKSDETYDGVDSLDTCSFMVALDYIISISGDATELFDAFFKHMFDNNPYTFEENPREYNIWYKAFECYQ